MSLPNLKYDTERERAFEIAQARAELLRLAEEQGVGPINNVQDLYGEPVVDDEGDDDVDNFLRLLSQWHDEDMRGVNIHGLDS